MSEHRSVVVASLTLATAVGAFGLVFGVSAVAAGASVAQTSVLSLLVFTGASQFAAVSVIATGGGGGAAWASAMLLSARNTVYGLTMSRIITGSLGRRLVAAHLVIDESTAMATAQSTPGQQRLAFWTTGAAVFAFWNSATVAGAVIGSDIDPLTYGLDAALPAGFVAMAAPHLRHRRGLIAGALGALICLVTIPFTPDGVPILAAATAVLIGLPEPEAGAG